MSKKDACSRCESLEKEVKKLKKINQVLVERVEHSIDLEGDGYALFQAAIALEDKIQDRTASLNNMVNSLNEANAALQIAKDKADKAVQAKSSFLARMSHELRTPMNAILGFGQLMQETTNSPLSEKHCGYLNIILKAGDHLLKLINEVLDITKIDAGKMRLSIVNVNAMLIVNDCIDLLKPVAAQRNITFVIDIDDNLNCNVKADSVRFKQILLNLLSNAIKYNKEGGQITLNCNHKKSGHIKFSISDQGKGISTDKFKQIFEPFERLEQHAEIKGSGMGLAVSLQFVKLMNGEIGVNSTQGEGCTFWFELPAGNTAVDKQAISLPAEKISASDSNKAFSLLYIEDNEDNTTLVSEVIKFRNDIQLITSTTAELGLDIAITYQPDLILLDIHLPDMNGNDLLINLLENKQTQKIPVIAISADAMEQDIKKALQNGFMYYLTKPLNISEFKGMINKYLPPHNKLI